MPNKSPYRVTLLSADGAIQELRIVYYAHDDQATDQTGLINHPHKILLHQGDKLVGEFPSLTEVFSQ